MQARMKKPKGVGPGGELKVGTSVVVDDTVTLRRKDATVMPPPNKPAPMLSSPYSFMRRSCTFVAESSLGLRKSAARTSFTGQSPSAQPGGAAPQKVAKDRRNLALQVRKKKDMLEESATGVGEQDGRLEDGVGSGGRISRLVGGLRAWSSTEDVRQSFMGALGRTVSGLKQKQVSRRVKKDVSRPDTTRPTHETPRNAPAKPQPSKTKTRPTADKTSQQRKSELGKLQFSKAPATGRPKSSSWSAVPVAHNSTHTSNTHASNIKSGGTKSTANQKWFRHIQEAQEAYTARDGRRHRPHPSTPLHDPDDQPPPPSDALPDVEDSNVEVEGGEAGSEATGEAADASRTLPSTPRTPEQGKADDAPTQPSPPSPDSLAKKTAEAAGGPGTPTPTPPAPTPGRSPAQGRRLQEVQIIQIVEGPTLIQPSEVKVSQGLVLSAQPVLTPIEHLRRKDLKIRQALREKQLIIADILNIPQEHFESVVDMAGEPSVGNKEPKELVLAAMFQAKCLQETLNEALSINEGDIVAARANSEARPAPSVPLYQAPMSKLMCISTTLSQQLSSLLNLVSERDDERERMRKELVASRERLHQLHMRQNSTPTQAPTTTPVGAQPLPPAVSPHTSRPNSFVSVASSAAEHSDTPEHHDTDEDGSGEGAKVNSTEETDQVKEETIHETFEDAVSGGEATERSKTGDVESSTPVEEGGEEGPGGEEGGGEASTT